MTICIGDIMKAEKWEFKTVLNLEFKCENCKTHYNIEYDVSSMGNKISNFNFECTKCKHLIKAEQ